MQPRSYSFYVSSLYSKRTRKIIISGKRFSSIGDAWKSVFDDLRAGESISMFWTNY